MMPLATSSPRVMPPKMLTRMPLTWVARHEEERLLHHLGLGAAADIEEIGGLAAGARHHIKRRHHEACAITNDAHISVELDVGQSLGLGFKLQRVRLFRLGPSGIFLLAWQCVVVHQNLGVGGEHLAIGGQCQRVDLGECSIALHKGLCQCRKDRTAASNDGVWDTSLGHQVARLERRADPSSRQSPA